MNQTDLESTDSFDEGFLGPEAPHLTPDEPSQQSPEGPARDFISEEAPAPGREAGQASPRPALPPAQGPRPKHPKAQSKVAQAIGEHMNDLNPLLADKERLKLSKVTDTINESYYRNWNRDSNRLFRLLVIFSKRLRRMEKGLRSN